MIFLQLVIIFLLIFFFFKIRKDSKLKKNVKAFKEKKIINFNKRNLSSWMNLTKKERYDQSREESISNFKKRKVLLEEIREEYKKISKGNTE
tara:strand:- start:188 stop:463 length:276 start_codon:yes stop_codon:yes gene_type:complete